MPSVCSTPPGPLTRRTEDPDTVRQTPTAQLAGVAANSALSLSAGWEEEQRRGSLPLTVSVHLMGLVDASAPALTAAGAAAASSAASPASHDIAARMAADTRCRSGQLTPRASLACRKFFSSAWVGEARCKAAAHARI